MTPLVRTASQSIKIPTMEGLPDLSPLLRNEGVLQSSTTMIGGLGTFRIGGVTFTFERIIVSEGPIEPERDPKNPNG